MTGLQLPKSFFMLDIAHRAQLRGERVMFFDPTAAGERDYRLHAAKTIQMVSDAAAQRIHAPQPTPVRLPRLAEAAQSPARRAPQA